MSAFTLKSACEDETTRIGKIIAMCLQAGDFLCLSGELGSGKSVLARGIIRKLANDDNGEVPSPTYTLCQSYETNPKISHFDLYRISGGMDELDELGWSEMLEEGAIIMEWPEKCFEKIPVTAVHVTFTEEQDGSRHLKFSGNRDLLERIQRSLLIDEFLSHANLGRFSRKRFAADASARGYEIIETDTETLYLMNAPEMPDGPPVKEGRPYSKIAHLAENVTAFVAIDEALREKGFAAPAIRAQNLEEGLLLIESLGNGLVIDKNRQPIPERYLAAIEFLARLHECRFSKIIKLKSGETHTIPAYDEEAIMIEAELLIDWYVPSQSGVDISDDAREAFEAIWQNLIQRLAGHEHGLVLRDFHSPNILWRETETGTDRIGVIDFQDALLGPSSYDVASLAQDARVDVSPDLENELVNHYILQRRKNQPEFDEKAFRESYAIMAALRATKILGIFIRLDRRDGKPAYLQHLPRMQDYLARSLKHPVLSEYRDWIERVIKM